MGDSTPRTSPRRTFIGWWMASLLTAIAAIALAPILVFLWPAPPKGQRKVTLPVSLPKGINLLADGEAIRFHAPSSPNYAFVMADGAGHNEAGDLGLIGVDGQRHCQVHAQR